MDDQSKPGAVPTGAEMARTVVIEDSRQARNQFSQSVILALRASYPDALL
jgi:hypothetical protein